MVYTNGIVKFTIIFIFQELFQWNTTYIFHAHPRSAVPTFNSCTKCMGSLGIIHDRKPN